MAEIRFVFCALSAFVGVGIASGWEVMRHFTRFGVLSVPLILLSGAAAVKLTDRCMQGKDRTFSCDPVYLRFPVLLLLLCAGGSMAAAAGELFALTTPIFHARTIGTALSLLVCFSLSHKPQQSLFPLSCLLLPLLLLALFLCLRVPGTESTRSLPGAQEALQGGLGALSFAGMNVLLASGALCAADEGCGAVQRCRSALWAGGALTVVLMLYHLALAPHITEMEDAALPMVMLLKSYGRAGYILSAAVLYFSCLTTWIPVMHSACALIRPVFPRYGGAVVLLLTGLISLLSPENIGEGLFPALGIFCFTAILLSGRHEKKSAASPRS